MSKIYEALRRHQSDSAPRNDTAQTRGPIVRALEAIYPNVYGLAKTAGRGLVLHFLGASGGEGVSTLSSEFALIAARVSDTRVLLLDADRSNLSTATRFGCPTSVGLIDQWQSGAPLEANLVRDNDYQGLQIGALCGKSSPPLSRRALPALYDQLRASYDLILLDCPAVFSDRYFDLCPEAADGLIFVVRAEQGRPEVIRQAQSLVEHAGGRFVGSILNRRHSYIPDWLYRLL
jgi:Mrp family chromosome partitioning ATPase